MSGIKNLIQQNDKGKSIPSNEQMKALREGRKPNYRPSIDTKLSKPKK